jgi:tetratricopeptide (TPR) repeat protein
VELRDALYHRISVPASPDEIREMVESVKAHVDEIAGVFGDIGALKPPVWYGRRGVGYSRFVGRLSYLWQIHSALHASEYSVITGTPAASSVDYVHGMGGVGKSLLAEEYARRYGAAFPGGVFWLSAFGNDDSKTGMGADEREAEREGQVRQIASALEIPVDGRSPAEIEGSLLAELGKRGEPFLWVVDDLPSGMDEGTVQRWLAPHPLGKTLITTRSHEYGSLGSEVRLDVLLPDEAYELLTSRREPEGAEEQVFARGIVKDLEYHALAVDVAGAAIHASSVVLPFADFEKELASSTSDDDVLEFAGELVGTLPHGHEASIASTFLKSIDRLESEEGLDFLRLASRLAVAPIPATLISSVFCEVDSLNERSGRRRADLAVNRAERLSLAERVEGDASAWSVHTLISRTMRFRDPTEERSEELWDAAVRVLTTAFRENADDPRDHAGLEPVVAHARELVDRADDLKTADLIVWVAQYDYKRGAYGLSETLYWREWETRRRVLGKEHRDTLRSMNNLAETLRAQGDLNGAWKIQEEVLEISMHVLGKEHPATLRLMGNIAGTLSDQGALDETRKIQEEVLEIRRRVLGSEHPDTLLSMNNLALTLSDQGELERAWGMNEDVLEIRRRVLGSEHPSTLKSMNNLAETLRAQGDLDGARKIGEEVLEIMRRVLGEEHPSTLTSMNNLALTLLDQGELERARKIQEEVLEIRRRILGSEHPSTSISAWNLFATFHELGDSDSAGTVLETDLLWLLDRDPASLGADQRRIREMVSQITGHAG